MAATDPRLPASSPEIRREWLTRPYRASDEVELARLFSDVFEKPVTPEWWLWKIRGRKGPAENVFVAVDAADGHVVAQYVALPIRVRLSGQVRDVMVTVDTMTAQDYRRRGILNTLAAQAYETWRAAGVAAVFGLPNEQAKTPSNERGWNALFPLPWLRLRLPARQLRNRLDSRPKRLLLPFTWLLDLVAFGQRWLVLRRLASVPGARNIEVERVQSAGSEFDDLYYRLAKHYQNLVERNAAWVQWRYLDARNAGLAYNLVIAKKNGIVVGYAAYRSNTAAPVPTGFLAGLFVEPKALDVAAALAQVAARDLFSQGAGSIMFAASPGSAPARLLSRLGFTEMGVGFNFEMVPLAADLDLTDLASPATWLLEGDDFDIV